MLHNVLPMELMIVMDMGETGKDRVLSLAGSETRQFAARHSVVARLWQDKRAGPHAVGWLYHDTSLQREGGLENSHQMDLEWVIKK